MVYQAVLSLYLEYSRAPSMSLACPIYHSAHIWIVPIPSSPQYESGIPIGSLARIWNAPDPSVWVWHALPDPQLISEMLQGMLATTRSSTTSTQHNMLTTNKHIHVIMQIELQVVWLNYQTSILKLACISIQYSTYQQYQVIIPMGRPWYVRPESMVRKTHLVLPNHTYDPWLLGDRSPNCQYQDNTPSAADPPNNLRLQIY